MKTTLLWTVRSVLALTLTFCAHAQLVNDGATNTLNAVATNLPGGLTVGTNGSFTLLTIDGGGSVSTVGPDHVGLNAGANTNRVVVSGVGSLWTNQTQVFIGSNGSGNQLTVSDGGRMASSNLLVGERFNSSNNLVWVTGSGSKLQIRETLNVGNLGDGNELVVTNGGSVTNLRNTFVGPQSASVGNRIVVTGAGSILGCGQNLIIGERGSMNQLHVTEGGRVVSGNFAGIGSNFGSESNVAVISGSNSLWDVNAIQVGDIGYLNRLVVSNGAILLSGSSVIGRDTGSNNAALVTGAGSRWTNTSTFAMGESGSDNSLTILFGGRLYNPNRDSSVGVATNANRNRVVVSGSNSLWSIGRSLFLGEEGFSNSLLVAAGGKVTATNLFIGEFLTSTGNSIIVDGGTIEVTQPSRTSVTEVRRGSLAVSSGSLLTDSLVLTNGSESRFSLTNGTLQTRRTVVGLGAEFLLGSGSLVLDLVGNGTHQFAAGLSLPVHARLQGEGTVLGALTNAGTLAPGAPVGQLRVSGPLVLLSGSTNLFELRKTIATNDNIVVSNQVTYGGRLIVTNAGGTFTLGDRFTLFQATSYAGIFTVLDLPPLPAGLMWSNRLGADGSIEITAATPQHRSWINPSAGDYPVLENWFLGLVPTPLDLAHFELDGSHAVNWTGDAAVHSAIFNAASGNHTLNVGPFAWTITNRFVLGSNGAANPTVTAASGTILVTNAGGTAVLEVRRGTLTWSGGEVVADQLVVTNSAGILALINNGTLRVGTLLHSNGTLLKVGEDTGANSFTLELFGPGPHVASRGLEILRAGTLTARGTFTGSITNSRGVLSPGPGLERLNIDGQLRLSGNTQTRTVLEISALLGTNDTFNVSGGVQYGGVLTVTNVAGTLAVGQRFQLFTASGLNGSFNSVHLPALPGGLFWTNRLLTDGSIEVLQLPPADRYWTNALGGTYATPANWLSNQPPNAQDTVWFTNQASYTVDWLANAQAVNAFFDATGNGTLTQNIGSAAWTVTSNYLVGRSAGATSTVVQATGRLNVTNSSRSAVLEARHGRFRMDDGVVEADQLLETNGNTQVDYLATNPRLTWNSGTLITRGGSIRGNLVVGSGGASPATLDVRSNQTLRVDSLLVLGRLTTNCWLYITNGGALHTLGSAYVGAGSPSNSAIVSGPHSLWQGDGSVRLGLDSRHNRLWVTNGGKIRSNRGSVGFTLNSPSGNNEAVLSDPGSSWSIAAAFAVGDASSSSNCLLVTNQAAIMASDVSIGVGESGNHLTVAGGAILQATNLLQILSSNNFLTVDGGTVVTTNVSRSGLTHLRNGTTRFEAGMWLTDRFWNDGSNSTLLFRGGTLLARSISNHFGSVFTVGNGTQAATLWLLSTGRHDFRNGLLLSSLGALVGNGRIVGDVTNAIGGTLAPGESIGTLTVDGHLTLAAGSTSVFELHKALSTNDAVVGISNLALGGTLVLTNLGGTLAAGDAFKIFDAQAYTGMFDSLILPPLNGGLYWSNRLILDGSLSVESSGPIDCYWTNSGSGTFSAPLNWLANQPPGVRDTARFTNAASHFVQFSAPARISSAYFDGGTESTAYSSVDLGANAWTVTNRLVVGREAGANAGLTLTNGWLQVTNEAGTAQLIVGQDGSGIFILNGSDAVVDQLIATNNVGGVENSTVSLAAGTLTTRRGALIRETSQQFTFGIGNAGKTMTWKMLGGTNTTDCSPVNDLRVGDTGRGVVWVDGPSTLWTNVGPSVVLNRGSSVIATNGARVLVNGTIQLGSDLLGSIAMSNRLVVTEGGLLACHSAFVGAFTNGAQNSALITGTNTAWLVRSLLTVGASGSSNQLVISNNAVVAAGSLVIGSAATASSNVVVVEGGNLRVSNATATAVLELGRNGGGVLRLLSGLVTVDRLLATNSPAGNLDFSGGVLRPGSVWYSNNNTFVVGNGVSPATLDLSSGATNLFARGLSVSSGSGLNGRGLIIGHLTNANGGKLAIGPGLDRLSIQGDLVLRPGSTTAIKLNKALGTNDAVVGISNLVLGGTLELTNLAGTVALGDSFKLFSASTYSGSFSSISPVSAGPGLVWDGSTLGVDGNLRVLIATPPVLRLSYFDSPTNQVFRFQVNNGQPGQFVCLLSTTNVGLPLTNWTLLASNVFDANGQLEGYVVPSDPARFYRLELK